MTTSAPTAFALGACALLLAASCFSDSPTLGRETETDADEGSTTATVSTSGPTTGSASTTASPATSGSPSTSAESSSATTDGETGQPEADYALAFAGAQNGTTPPLPGLPPEYTIEFWLKSEANLHGFVMATVDGDPPLGWTIFHAEGAWTAFDNVLAFIDYDAPDWYYVVDPDLDLRALPGWHHVAVCKDAEGLVRLFLDGGQVAEQSFMVPFVVAERALTIGSNVSEGLFLEGAQLDDLRISNSVRYDGVFAPDESLEADENTLYLWTFDEGDGTAAIDELGGVVIDLVNPMWVER